MNQMNRSRNCSRTVFSNPTGFHSRAIDTHKSPHLKIGCRAIRKLDTAENIDAIDRDDRPKTIDVLNRHRATPHHRSHGIASPIRSLLAG
jgi:hypothetical protein